MTTEKLVTGQAAEDGIVVFAVGGVREELRNHFAATAKMRGINQAQLLEEILEQWFKTTTRS